MASPSPTQSSVQTALRAFLLSILPAGMTVVAGQANRVSEPSQADFVVFTAIMRERIETNFVAWADVAFTGSVSGVNLTVASVQFGAIAIGSTLFGVGVASPTTIVSQTSGAPGGAGVYVVSQGQTIASSVLAAGNVILTQPVKITFQVDVHGPNSADNAQAISTLFRSEIATSFFNAPASGIDALYADDPRQMPFDNGEQQVEFRWIINAVMQANQAIPWPQDFMGSAPIVQFIPAG